MLTGSTDRLCSNAIEGRYGEGQDDQTENNKIDREMSTRSKDIQPALFELTEPEIKAATVQSELHELAARLPSSVRFGTMSWSFPGWRGLVFDSNVDAKRLSGGGLAAYVKHPLFGAVEIDRSYYEPLEAEIFQRYAKQVPESFRFLVKAHEECTTPRFPLHARYGKKRGLNNPHYFDASYATDMIVGPTVEGLGPKLGALLFQCPPQEVYSPSDFVRRLRAFLKALPPGVPYAVELRNRELFTPEYAAALAETGAVHCHNAWSHMPSVLEQAKLIPPVARRPLVVRWLLRRGEEYEAARERFAPFDRIVEEDVASRESIARLVSKAAQHGVTTLVLINNKAEGCAPESIFRLAQDIADRGL